MDSYYIHLAPIRFFINILILKFSWTWPVRAPSSWFVCPIDIFLWFFEYLFSLQQDDSGSSCSFLVIALQLAIPLRKLGSFYWRRYLKAKVCALIVHIATYIYNYFYIVYMYLKFISSYQYF